tara:strand:- start:9977 stop:12307 length:2331 start_codon:yes stop_codon:yes gene_type:complete
LEQKSSVSAVDKQAINYFELMFNQHHEAHALIDGSGSIVRANLAFCRLLSVEQDELLYKNFSLVAGWPASDGSISFKALTKQNKDFFFSLYTSQSTPIEVVASFYAIQNTNLDDNEKPILVCLRKKPTDDVKNTELRRQQNLLSQLEAIAQIGAWELDITSHEMLWSDRTYDIFEVPATHSPSYRSMLRFFPGEASDILEILFDDLKRWGKGFDLELPVITAQGHSKWVRCQSQRDLTEDQVRIHGILMDISDKRRSEQAIRESEGRFRAVYDHAAMGIVVVSNSTNIVSANIAFCQMVGAEQSEIVVQPIASVVGAYEPLELNECLEKLFSGDEQTIKRELFGKDRAGLELCLSMTASFITTSQENKPMAVLLFDNITQTTQLQRQLQQAQKMEAIGQLTGGIAHDFNNLLASIMGYASLAKEKYSEVSGAPKLSGYLQQIITASERAKDLIQKMLAFSRGGEAELKRCDLVHAIQEAVVLLSSAIPSTIRIEKEITEGLPLIMADATQINQVLLNLCINSRDALDNEKGAIRIGLKQAPENSEAICSSCREPIHGAMLELSVSDNGDGIPEEILEKVFDPFFTTKPVGKGSGMGLAMVHGIIHDHFGHLVVESTPDKGTTFKLFFPVALSLANESVPSVTKVAAEYFPSAMSCRTNRIMVVDDDAAVAELTSELLRTQGYDVDSYTSSDDAFAAFKLNTQGYQAIISDQTMPGMTGSQLASKIAEISPEIPFILCSGYKEAIANSDIQLLGIDACLDKPFNREELISALEQVLV